MMYFLFFNYYHFLVGTIVLAYHLTFTVARRVTRMKKRKEKEKNTSTDELLAFSPLRVGNDPKRKIYRAEERVMERYREID